MTGLVVAVVLGCGHEAWAAKTLADPGAEAALTRPVTRATVEEIGRLDPSTPPGLYETEGVIPWHATEEDEDLHVDLVGGRGGSMVNEYPSEECMPMPDESPPAVAAAVRGAVAARAKLLEIFRHNRHPRVRVIGKLFFDKCIPGHEPRGHAPIHDGLCAELHPITFVEEIAPADGGGGRR